MAYGWGCSPVYAYVVAAAAPDCGLVGSLLCFVCEGERVFPVGWHEGVLGRLRTYEKGTDVVQDWRRRHFGGFVDLMWCSLLTTIRTQSQEELKEDLKNGDDKEEEEDPVAVAKSAVKKMKRATQKAMSSSGKGKGKGKGRSRKGRKAEGGSVRKILQKRRKTVQIQIPEELSKTLPVERKPQRIRKFLEYSNGRLKVCRDGGVH